MTTVLMPPGSNSSNLIYIKRSPANTVTEDKKFSLPSFFVSNVCHIINKVTELLTVVSINSSTVNLIVESWLSDAVPDSAINIGSNYQIFRLDRQTPGGGVLAYIDGSVPVYRISNLELTGKDVLWLLLNLLKMIMK